MATVLVVDDDAALLRLAASILESAGHKVLRASNGVEALLLFQSYSSRLDLVLTDVDMPQMNGLELAARIRATRPASKVLLMSGGLPPGISLLPKAYPHLAKPFQPAALVEAVQKAVGGV
jgi:CheY-like chemotaxis protein